MSVDSTLHKNGSFGRDVLKLVFGTTFSQVLALLVAPVLTRMYTPDMFGTLAAFASIASLLGIVSCLRYESAIPLPKRDGDAAALFCTCIFCSIGVAVCTWFLIGFMGEWLTAVINVPELSDLIRFVPVYSLLMGVGAACSAWNARKRRFGQISFAQAGNSFTGALIKVVLGWLRRVSGGGLVLGSMAGLAALVVIQGGGMWQKDRSVLWANLRFSKAWEQIKRYRKFPLVDTWGALLNNASWHIPTLLFAFFFSSRTVGFYSLSFRVLQLPMLLLGTSLGQVFYQRTAELRSSNVPIDTLTTLTFRRLVTVALLPCLLLGIAGPELFAFVFGVEWVEAGVYSRILSPWIFIWLISSPISLVLIAAERQGTMIMFHSAVFVSRLVAVMVGGRYHDVRLALALFSGFGVLSYGLLLVKIFSVSGCAWGKIWPAIRIPCFYGILISGIVLLFKHYLETTVSIAGVLGGAIVLYAFAVLWSDPPLCRMLIGRLKGK